jgi:hypothetical protein
MTRMPVLPDAPPLLADANARFRKRRWTPLRVFAWTFLFASLALWLAALPGIRATGQIITQAWKKSPAHEQLDDKLHANSKDEWRPRLK